MSKSTKRWLEIAMRQEPVFPEPRHPLRLTIGHCELTLFDDGWKLYDNKAESPVLPLPPSDKTFVGYVRRAKQRLSR